MFPSSLFIFFGCCSHLLSPRGNLHCHGLLRSQPLRGPGFTESAEVTQSFQRGLTVISEWIWQKDRVHPTQQVRVFEYLQQLSQHLRRLSENAFRPLPLDFQPSGLLPLGPLLNSGSVVTCLWRFAPWSPASFGSWDSGLRVAGRGSLHRWSSVGWLLSRRSLDRRWSGRIGCARHVSIHRRLQVTAMTVNQYVFEKKNQSFSNIFCVVDGHDGHLKIPMYKDAKMYSAYKCCFYTLHRKGGMLGVFRWFFMATSPIWRPEGLWPKRHF